MTQRQEWYSTTHPFFSVYRESSNVFDETGTPEQDEQVLVIAADEAAVIQGDLESFAAKVVQAVFGIPLTWVWGMYRLDEDGKPTGWIPLSEYSAKLPLTESEEKHGWLFGRRLMLLGEPQPGEVSKRRA